MEHIYKESQFGEEWFGFPHLYTEMVNKFSTNSRFVEVGSWKGKSAAYMAVEIANSGKTIDFVCVDTWNGSEFHVTNNWPGLDKLYDTFKSNMRPLEKYYRDVRLPSVEAAKLFADKSIDFVFIDACHEYESVRDDIESWLPKVKNGGIIAGHDYVDRWPGVIRAVAECLPASVKILGDTWLYEVGT